MIPILYEDKQLIVVEKPGNMPSQKDFSRTLDLLTVCTQYLGEKPFLIHRLDRHVQGPVVLAKTKKAAAFLNAQLKGVGFNKIYKAVVIWPSGREWNSKENIELRHYIKKGKDMATVISQSQYDLLANGEKSDYKEAILKYRCLDKITYDTIDVGLLEIELITGRFHQIRAQLSFVGLGIVGDPKYGSRDVGDRSFDHIGLQSTSLSFTEPQNNKKIQLVCEHNIEPFDLFDKV